MDDQIKEVVIDEKRIVKQLDFDLGADEPKVEVKAEPAAVKEQPVQQVQQNDATDQGVELLRRQLAEKQREAEEQKRLRMQAEDFANKKAQEVQQMSMSAQDSQLTAFVNAIASFERDGEMLERDYASNLERGDYAQAAKIQRQMAQIESRLTQLAQGKVALEERLEYERHMASQPRQQYQQPQPQVQQVAADPIEQKLSTLSPASASWVRAHVEVLKDPAKNAEMTAGHYSAVAKGIQVDSPEYFSFLDRHMGYNNSRPAQSSGRAPSTAAPVTRSPITHRNNGTVAVQLTPAQRQMAADLGMEEDEYAAGFAYYVDKGEIRI